MTRIALILISEISGFFYYLFQLTESKVDAFDKYGPLSVAALAILANFYFLKMFIDREKKRDEQNAKRDESRNRGLPKWVRPGSCFMSAWA